MNEALERQLIRQLKILNFWITSFGIVLMIGLAIIGYLLFQTVMFMKTTSDNLQNFKNSTSQNLDIKAQVCGGNDNFSNFIRSTGACN